VSDHALYRGFLESAERTPDRPALWVNGRIVSYSELRSEAMSLAATLQRTGGAEAPRLTAVFADRSRTGFAGILGVLFAGHAYVPLNATFPLDRTRQMLRQTGIVSLVVDSAAEPQLDGLLADWQSSFVIIIPERQEPAALSRRWPQHRFIGARELVPAAAWKEPRVDANDLAYLLFTSGSTGVPKGVGVAHANATHFVDSAAERYDVVPADRLSQTFDATFDLSVFDLFVAWRRSACVYCPSRATLFNPDRFIREHQLTVWFSVPTIGMLMRRLGALKPDRFPSLRWSLFCGEPLPKDVVEAWADAAPASTIENLYGPTELTVACTAYRWDPARSPGECMTGIVPIGAPINGMHARVVDDRLVDVEPGGIGELLMAGPQRVHGYWRDAAATERAFVQLPGESEIFYRTGDRVRQPVADGPLHYVGRVDHQIKVLGHRVELEEIESVLREQAGVQQAVALGWPQTSTGTGGVVAFVTGNDIDLGAIGLRLRQRLQAYAVPRAIHVLPLLPQNVNGKVDRHALLELLNA
jgi:amino acid adenylation domain-containing protein